MLGAGWVRSASVGRADLSLFPGFADSLRVFFILFGPN
jgi:hypothetical protein